MNSELTPRNVPDGSGGANVEPVKSRKPRPGDARTFRHYLDTYPDYHRNPVNKVLHLVGIPSIILGIVLGLATGRLVSLALVLIGAVLLGIGHHVEGNRPALVTNPIYLLVGPVWMVRRVYQLGPWARRTPRP